MRHVIWVVATALSVSGAVVAQSTSRQVLSNGRPIHEQLGPTDQRIRLERRSSPPLVVVAPPGKHLDMMTDLSDLILIVRVEGKKSELTERQNWIRSVVSARVERVLKASPQLAVSQGERVSFNESGGTMQIGSATVEAAESWAIPFEEGKRYLMFAGVSNGQLIVGPSSSYGEVVRSSTAQRLMKWGSPDESDEIENFGLDVAGTRIEERLQAR